MLIKVFGAAVQGIGATLITIEVNSSRGCMFYLVGLQMCIRDSLYIAQGQYERAVNSFGDSKTNSAALAQILAKDYNKAKNTLANVERPDAYTDYLMAVLGARTNNSSMVTSSLKSAVAKDSSLAKKAATDLEFAKYFTNADFMNIVK